MSFIKTFADAANGQPVTAGELSKSDPGENRAIVIDLSTDKILYSEGDINERFNEASITKIMAAAVVFDLIKSGKMTAGENLPVSTYANSVPNGLPVLKGEKITVEQALYGGAIRSYNNFIYALAERGGEGNESSEKVNDFVRRMNDKAREWGMGNTHFTNPVGFAHPDHYTTTQDLAAMFKHMQEEYPEEFAKYFGQAHYTLNTNLRTIQLENTSRLIGNTLTVGKTGTNPDLGAGLAGITPDNQFVFVGGTGEDRNDKVEKALAMASQNTPVIRSTDFFVDVPGYTTSEGIYKVEQKHGLRMDANKDGKIGEGDFDEGQSVIITAPDGAQYFYRYNVNDWHPFLDAGAGILYPEAPAEMIEAIRKSPEYLNRQITEARKVSEDDVVRVESRAFKPPASAASFIASSKP